MNQKCKVCGEPAAGFHFGAFTCEGCKSFFGRSYNNLNSITECKNNGECVINKKNRTACKACRLRKCLLVGMSKSGSRYGRRSNWFKIHCLLQEQQQQMQDHHHRSPPPQHHPGHPHPLGPPPFPPHLFPSLTRTRTEEEMTLLGLEEYSKPHTNVTRSPNSNCEGSSPRRDDMKMPRSLESHHLGPTPPRDAFPPLRLGNFIPHSPFLPPVGPMGAAFNPFASTHPLIFHGIGGLHPAIYSHRALLEAAARRSQDAHNNNNLDEHSGISPSELRKPPPPAPREETFDSRRSTPCSMKDEDVISECNAAPQENPMDLSVRSDGRSSSTRRRSDASSNCGGVVSAGEDEDESVVVSASEDEEAPFAQTIKRIKLHPLDLTTKV